MKTSLILILLFVTMTVAQATPSFALNPLDGAISGAPGDTVGWGFHLTADSTDWVSVIGTLILTETNPLGVFTDFIGPQGGPSSGVLAPGDPDWIQDFDPVGVLGLGSYVIDPATPVGQIDSGTFLIQYETFSDNPATCGSCFLSSDQFMQDFTIGTVSSAPEPATWSITLVGVAIIACLILMKRPASNHRAHTDNA